MLEDEMFNGKIREPEKLLTVDSEYDVAVVCGGIAGIGSSSRKGWAVLSRSSANFIFGSSALLKVISIL